MIRTTTQEAQPNYTPYKKATWRLDRNLENYYRKRKHKVRKLFPCNSNGGDDDDDDDTASSLLPQEAD